MINPANETLLTRVEKRIAPIQRNAHRVIYGYVTVMAVLLANGRNDDGAIETSVIMFGSISAIVLAEKFAKISSDFTQNRQWFGWDEVRAGWHHSRPTLIAAISLLALYGYSTGWVVYERSLPGLLHEAFTGGIGLVLALIKYGLH